MTTRVLVTGGAGFIGSHVADLFLAKGWAVDIIDNLSSGKRENVPDAATLHVVDIRSERGGGDRHERRVRRRSSTSPRRWTCGAAWPIRCSMRSVNILGTLNLLEALRASGRGREHALRLLVDRRRDLRRLLDAAEPRDDAEGAGFAVRDRQASRRVLPVVLHAHPRLRRGERALRQRVWAAAGSARRGGRRRDFLRPDPRGPALTVFGDGEQTRDYVHVSDVADATYRAATTKLDPPRQVDDRSFNVGTGEGKSVLEFAHTLLAAAGSRAADRVRAEARRASRRTRSSRRTRRAHVLGWSPRVSLAEGLADTYAWFAARANKPAVQTART